MFSRNYFRFEFRALVVLLSLSITSLGLAENAAKYEKKFRQLFDDKFSSLEKQFIERELEEWDFADFLEGVSPKQQLKTLTFLCSYLNQNEGAGPQLTVSQRLFALQALPHFYNNLSSQKTSDELITFRPRVIEVLVKETLSIFPGAHGDEPGLLAAELLKSFGVNPLLDAHEYAQALRTWGSLSNPAERSRRVGWGERSGLEKSLELYTEVLKKQVESRSRPAEAVLLLLDHPVHEVKLRALSALSLLYSDFEIHRELPTQATIEKLQAIITDKRTGKRVDELRTLAQGTLRECEISPTPLELTDTTAQKVQATPIFENYVQRCEALAQLIVSSQQYYLSLREIEDLNLDQSKEELSIDESLVLAKRLIILFKRKDLPNKVRQVALKGVAEILGRPKGLASAVQQTDTSMIVDLEEIVREFPQTSEGWQLGRRALHSLGRLAILSMQDYVEVFEELLSLADPEQKGEEVPLLRFEEGTKLADRFQRRMDAIQSVSFEKFPTDSKLALKRAWIQQLSAGLTHRNSAIVLASLRGIGFVAKRRESGSRLVIADEITSQILSIADAAEPSSVRLNVRDKAKETLRQLGIERVEKINTLSEFVDALKEYSLGKNLNSERKSVLYSSLKEFVGKDTNFLDNLRERQKINPEERRKALTEIYSVAANPESSNYGRAWALGSLGALLRLEGARMSLAQMDRELYKNVISLLWEHSRQSSTTGPPSLRLRSIALVALKEIGQEGAITAPAQYFDAVLEWVDLSERKVELAKRRSLKLGITYFNTDEVPESKELSNETRQAYVDKLGQALGSAKDPESKTILVKALSLLLDQNHRASLTLDYKILGYILVDLKNSKPKESIARALTEFEQRTGLRSDNYLAEVKKHEIIVETKMSPASEKQLREAKIKIVEAIKSEVSTPETRLVLSEQLLRDDCGTCLGDVLDGLKNAFARADNSTLLRQAQLLDGLQRKYRITASEDVFLAARWASNESLPEQFIAHVQDGDSHKLRGLLALFWLNAHKVRGTPFMSEGDQKSSSFILRDWLLSNKLVFETILNLVDDTNAEVRRYAFTFLKTRALFSAVDHDNNYLIEKATNFISRRPSAERVKEAFAVLDRVSPKKLSAQSVKRLLVLNTSKLNEQFMPEAADRLVSFLERIEEVDFSMADLKVVDFLDFMKIGLSSQQPSTLSTHARLANLVASQNPLALGTEENRARLLDLAQVLRTNQHHPDPSIGQNVRRILRGLGQTVPRDSAVLAERDEKRLPLRTILQDLLNPVDAERQLEAARALAEWSPSQNQGREVLTEELKEFNLDFSGILARILLNDYDDTLDLRRALIENLRHCAKRSEHLRGFEPALQNAVQLQKAIAELLFSEDEAIRAEALTLTRRKLDLSLDDKGVDPHEEVIGKALLDQERRQKAFALIRSLTRNTRLEGSYSVPRWLRLAPSISAALIQLMQDQDESVRDEAAHILIYNLASLRTRMQNSPDHGREISIQKAQTESVLKMFGATYEDRLPSLHQYVRTQKQVGSPQIVSAMLELIKGSDDEQKAAAFRTLGFRDLREDADRDEDLIREVISEILKAVVDDARPAIQREALGALATHTGLVYRLVQSERARGTSQSREVELLAAQVNIYFSNMDKSSSLSLILAKARPEFNRGLDLGEARSVFEEQDQLMQEGRNEWPSAGPQVGKKGDVSCKVSNFRGQLQ